MKALRTFLLFAVLGSIIALSGCGGGGGNNEPITDKQLGLLSKTWKVKSSGGVMYGSGASSVDSTSHWTNFTLTISGTKGQTTFNYTCAGRPTRSVWPSSGTWSFVTASPTNTITRDPGGSDALTITYSVDASGSNLQLQFTFNGTGYTNRSTNVSGDWTFNLIPN